MLRQKVKRFLALRALRDDKALMRQLSEENKKTLESKWKDLEGDIPFSLLSAYRHLAKPGESGVEWSDLGLPTVGEKGSLSRRVREHLKSQELLLESISSHNLLKKALREDEQEKLVSEIAEAFLRYPQLPMVGSREVIEQAIRQGVLRCVFGIKVGERVYFGEVPPIPLFEADAVLVREERVIRHDRAVAEPSPTSLQATSALSPEPDVLAPVSAAPSPEAGGRHLRLRVKVPWDKLSDFVRGVILPLRNDGAELEVEVLVQAQSESGGIKPATLEHKVKETLRQIGAEIVEEHTQ